MGKRKYSTDFKLEIVLRYLNDNVGIRQLAQEYYVSRSDIQKWKDAYLVNGIEGLCTTNGTYSGDFKVSVVEYMHRTGTSLRKTAAFFNIPSYVSVRSWEKIYNELGRDALYNENRGRASKMGVKKTNNKKKSTESHKDLLAEIERLRMENEYLKKLNALVQNRDKSEKPTK